MKTLSVLLSLVALTSCASGPPQGRGGYHRGGYPERGGAQQSPFGASTLQPAHPGAAPDAVLIAGFDEDFDLVISPNEITDGIAREFARADTNHDHTISHAEFAIWSERAFGGSYAPHWLAFDTDGDARITAAEFAAEIHTLVSRYDVNGDGVIDHAELVRPDITRMETADPVDDDREPLGGRRAPPR